MEQTRSKAIRAKCLKCSENAAEVKNCPIKDCKLYPYRMGKNFPKGYSLPKAIKEYCLWCSGDSFDERRLCPSSKCVLWEYRLGTITSEKVKK